MKKKKKVSTQKISIKKSTAKKPAMISTLNWQVKTIAQVRKLIKEAIPQVTEELKWRGIPVWYHEGMICTGETYKDKIKLTFAHGAKLKDPNGLFNSSLEGNTRRAIDIRANEKINATAFKALIKEAAAFNVSK